MSHQACSILSMLCHATLSRFSAVLMPPSSSSSLYPAALSLGSVSPLTQLDSEGDSYFRYCRKSHLGVLFFLPHSSSSWHYSSGRKKPSCLSLFPSLSHTYYAMYCSATLLLCHIYPTTVCYGVRMEWALIRNDPIDAVFDSTRTAMLTLTSPPC